MEKISKNPLNMKTLLVGIALCFCIAAGEPFGVMRLNGSPLAADYSTGAAIFLFFVLVFVINSLLKLIGRSFAFDSRELAVIYIMMIIACAIPSWGFTMNLIFLIAGVKYFATSMNGWAEIIHPHIPSWVLPQGEDAIRTLFEGLPSNSSIPWLVWLKPLSFWFGFIMVVYLTMVCIAVILRKQWIQNERLLFPLMKLPEEMCRDGKGILSGLFKNKIMWIGFLIPLFFYSMKALRGFFPFIPQIRLGVGIPVFAQTGWIPVRLQFEMLGLAYLLTLDISLSLWFFGLLYWIEHCFFDRIGFSLGVRDMYCAYSVTTAYQQFGAFVVYGMSAFWMARRHIKNIFNRAFGGNRENGDKDEMISYRAAALGSIVGIILIAAWLRVTGFSILGIMVFLPASIIIFVGLTKIVCQTGMPYGRQPLTSATFTLDAIGSNGLGGAGCTGMAMTSPWAGDVRTMVMASIANGFKLLDSFGIKGRKIFLAVSLALVVGLVSSMWAVLVISYKFGGMNCGGWQPVAMSEQTFSWLRAILIHGRIIDLRRFGFMGIGGGLMIFLIWARNIFLWWPLHPVGLAISFVTPAAALWFSIFLAWLLKLVILKYGGIKLYRQLLPFFFGLILGSFTSAGLWNVILFFTGETGIRLTAG